MDAGARDAAVVEVEYPQGVMGLGPTVRRGAWIAEEELAVHPEIVPRDMAVPEQDDGGTGETAMILSTT